jgi:hypothetical protein
MKKIFYKGILLAVVLIGINMINPVFGDNPPPPPPENGQGGNVPGGGGAPIGEGIFILSLLGTAYGAKKWQKSKQTN